MTAKILPFPVLAFPASVVPASAASAAGAAQLECPPLRQRILIAAHALYNQPCKVGIPEIAAAAGVVPAQVEALFDDEPGVRRAVLDELLALALAAYPDFGRPMQDLATSEDTLPKIQQLESDT
jgi:AcrR family transcriptional regulator